MIDQPMLRSIVVGRVEHLDDRVAARARRVLRAAHEDAGGVGRVRRPHLGRAGSGPRVDVGQPADEVLLLDVAGLRQVLRDHLVGGRAERVRRRRRRQWAGDRRDRHRRARDRGCHQRARGWDDDQRSTDPIGLSRHPAPLLAPRPGGAHCTHARTTMSNQVVKISTTPEGAISRPLADYDKIACRGEGFDNVEPLDVPLRSRR